MCVGRSIRGDRPSCDSSTKQYGAGMTTRSNDDDLLDYRKFRHNRYSVIGPMCALRWKFFISRRTTMTFNTSILNGLFRSTECVIERNQTENWCCSMTLITIECFYFVRANACTAYNIQQYHQSKTITHLADKFFVCFEIQAFVQCATFNQIHDQITFGQNGCVHFLNQTVLLLNDRHILADHRIAAGSASV